MSEIKLLSASEAKNLADNVMSAIHEALMGLITNAIRREATLGKHIVTINAIHYPQVIKALKDVGYQVDYTYDQRDGNFYTIKW